MSGTNQSNTRMSEWLRLNAASHNPRTVEPPLLNINSSITYFVVLLALAAIYFAAAELGLSLAFIHVNVSPVWPPTGVAIAAMLLLGRRVWPGIFAGAFIANFFTPIPIAGAIGIAIGNTLEAVVAASMLKRFGFHPRFDRTRDVTWFIGALAAGTMVSATIGNISLSLSHTARWEEFGRLWLTWWLGDLVGGLTLAPLLIVWLRTAPSRLASRWVEAVALYLSLAVVGMIVFGGWFPGDVKTYPLAHVTLPFLIWAAFRLGHRGVTLSVLLSSAFAIWGTSRGFGPFARGTPNESLLLVEVFVGVISVACLFLVAVVEERRLGAKTLRESERRLGANLAVTRILAESPALADATPRIIETICETLGWELGGFWILDRDREKLRCLNFWHRASAASQSFANVCMELTFDRGIGLPGRVWQTLRPAWIPDVEKDDNFPRAPYAIAAGLHAAFAFPIMLGTRCLGVMEFFSREIRQPDSALLSMFGSIGGQIGQFMERRRNEEEREHLLLREFAARAEAEQANRTKDEFLAIVSHELRTPLNAIVGWASLLRSGSLDQARSMRAIEVIDRNAKAQAQLIEDILDVSRIVSGNLRLEPRAVQVQQVIEAALDSIRPAADAKQMRLSLSIDPNAGPVSGDPERLQQIVWNLLSNAVKFTPAGGRISVSLLETNSHVEIAVSDTGQGIPPQFLPHVFDRFRQADGSKTRRHGGLGLGLAIVRNLVELHGGTVTAKSDGERRGTTFTIKLPCAGVSTTPPRTQSFDLATPVHESDSDLEGVRILVVEDDTDSREMVQMVLKSHGADVVSAGSVEAALTVLTRDQWKPQLVISDLGMPRHDGYDLIKKIRCGEVDHVHDVPAIAITGFAGDDERERSIDAGFQKHLTKPINWRALIDTIAELTSR